MGSITRVEQYLSYLNGENVEIPEPITRVEQYLYDLCVNGGVDGEIVMDAVNNYLNEHGVALTMDSDGYVKLGGTANGN